MGTNVSYAKCGWREKFDSTARDGGYSPIIAKEKIKAFKTLFLRIEEKIGNYKKTVVRIGIGHDAMSDLYSNKRLTSVNARRILKVYKEFYQ